MEKRNIPKKDTNTKKDSQLRKDAIKVIRTKQIINILLVLVLIVLIGSGALLIYLNTATIKIDNNTPDFVKKIVELNDKLIPKKATPAAVVNGEEISMAELDDRYNILPASYKSLVTKGEVLSQMIDEKLLLQQAARENITATQDDIDNRIQTLLTENQITQEQFDQAIASRNLTMASVRDFYAKEIVLTKLINLDITSKIVLSDNDIQDYYDSNIDQFKIPESVNVSHILICHNESLRCVSNLTKEEALAKALKVRKLINATNFGEIALNYSDEPAAKITNGNLGWISLESPFDKTFMNATFALAVGNVSDPVETVFGYHLIKVFEKKEAGILNLTAVFGQINQTLTLQKEKDDFGVYLSTMRNSSDIINYVEKKN